MLLVLFTKATAAILNGIVRTIHTNTIKNKSNSAYKRFVKCVFSKVNWEIWFIFFFHLISLNLNKCYLKSKI